MVYFFHHYEIPAIIQQGTVHNITATVNIHEHQRAPERRADQVDTSLNNTATDPAAATDPEFTLEPTESSPVQESGATTDSLVRSMEG